MDGNIGQSNKENLNLQDASGTADNFENFNVSGTSEEGKEISNIEIGKETEQAVTQGERQPAVSGGAAPVPVITPQVPIRSATTDDVVVNSNEDELPLVAGHSDKIEKQWVEMGEKIIDNTKHDPREQKTQIDGLKDKYQTARYGNKEG